MAARLCQALVSLSCSKFVQRGSRPSVDSHSLRLVTGLSVSSSTANTVSHSSHTYRSSPVFGRRPRTSHPWLQQGPQYRMAPQDEHTHLSNIPSEPSLVLDCALQYTQVNESVIGLMIWGRRHRFLADPANGGSELYPLVRVHAFFLAPKIPHNYLRQEAPHDRCNRAIP